MANYLLTYHGTGGEMPQTPEAQKAVMDAWMGWFGSLGDAVVDGGNPISAAKSVAGDGSVSDVAPAAAMGGYSVLKADNIEAAVKMAQGCPHRLNGGSIQVSETFNVM